MHLSQSCSCEGGGVNLLEISVSVGNVYVFVNITSLLNNDSYRMNVF